MFAWQVDADDIAEVGGGRTCVDFELFGGIEGEVGIGDVLDDEGFESGVNLGKEDCGCILGDIVKDNFVSDWADGGRFCQGPEVDDLGIGIFDDVGQVAGDGIEEPVCLGFFAQILDTLGVADCAFGVIELVAFDGHIPAEEFVAVDFFATCELSEVSGECAAVHFGFCHGYVLWYLGVVVVGVSYCCSICHRGHFRV